MDALLTVEEVAEKLKITPKTVRKYVTDGELKAIQFDRAYRFREEDVEAFLDARTINSTEE